MTHVLQEPHVYRMHEAVMHYGEAIKAIINEECGASAAHVLKLWVILRSQISGECMLKELIVSEI